MSGEVIERVVQLRTTGHNVAEHVWYDHTEMPRQRPDISLVGFGMPARAVQHEERRTRSSLQNSRANACHSMKGFADSRAQKIEPDAAALGDITTHRPP